jgi:Outer membrane efflux protein
MNTRAQLVDAWRQVRVFANSLLGTFNVQYHGDTSTPPGANMPLAFQGANTRHQLVMNFELPLVRMAERNAYRASLIALQRSRRDVMQKEDEIVAQVRADIRQLQVLAKNFIIQQQAVELAYQQVESSLETFRAPQVPDNSPNAAANAAGSAAALTNQLLQAYGRLPQAKEQVLKTWVDYQIARQQLYLDIELMPIDARGVWIDEYADVAPDRKTSQLEREPGGVVRADVRNTP